MCRINGIAERAAIRTKLDFVEDFAQIGSYFDEPVKTYSSGMRARLGFALSMAFDFDYYLIDEVLSVGDHGFRAKCQRELAARRGRSTFIVASHNLNTRAGDLRDRGDRARWRRRPLSRHSRGRRSLSGGVIR